MENFVYHNPVEVIFETGCAAKVGDYAARLGKKAMLVTYESADFLTGLFEDMHASLREHGVDFCDYFGASPNPTLAQARRGIDMCRREQADVIIGIGGGSAMDCAKVIAAGVCYEHELEEMILFSHSDGNQIPPEKALPMILIPTLPATGSEMNPTAVITNEKTMRKSYVWAPDCLYARYALMDPELTVGLPPYQTACGAVDTIAHIAESYFNGTAAALDVQDRMQEGVIRAVLDRLPAVLANPGDTDGRGVMLWAASIALNGWLLSGTYTWAPMHQMGHVLSAQYNATHGATLGVMILAWMRFYVDRPDNGRYVQYARRIYGKSLSDAADEYEAFLVSVGLPTTISAFGATEADISRLALEVEAVSFGADGLLASNPPLRREDIETIYRLAL